MSDIVDRIPFGAGTGLNSDDQLLILPKGDSRERRNVFLSDDGDYNLLTNIPSSIGSYNVDGDIGISNPIGTNTVIGYTEDKQNNAGYYFVHNSNNNHYIIKISEDYPIVIPPIDPVYSRIFIISGTFGGNLDFDLDSKISATVLDGNYLYWTDGLNPPRKINISEARKLTIGAGSIYTSFNDEQISSVYYPPNINPKVQLATDPSFSKTLLDQEQFQFAYTYVYEDNTETTLSPWSEFVYSTNKFYDYDPIAVTPRNVYELSDASSNANETLNVAPNNVILIQYVVPTDLVLSVKLYVRYGFNADWLLYDVIESPGSGTYVYQYYNDKNVKGVDNDFAFRGFYDVPITADTQEIINNSVIVYGQYKNTRDNFDLASNVTFSGYPSAAPFRAVFPVSLTSAPAAPVPVNQLVVTKSDIIADQDLELSDNLNFSLAGRIIVYGGQTFYFPSNYGLHTDFYDKTASSVHAAVLAHATAMANYMADRTSTVVNVTDLGVGSGARINFSGSITQSIALSLNKMSTYKTESKYRGGIVFFDDLMRTSGVITNDDMEFETPPSVNTGSLLLNDYVTGFKATISNATVPSWAKYWTFVTTRNLTTSNFINGVFTGTSVGSPDITFNATIDKWQIDINREINDLHTEKPQYKNGIGTYTFNAGDRIKIYGRSNFDGLALEFTSGNIYDVEIMGQTGNIITINLADQSATFNTDINYPKIVYEIYTPLKQNDSEVYFEVGGVKPISDYIVGDFYVSTGDAYVGRRFTSAATTQNIVPLLTQNSSDFDVEENANYGRPQSEQTGVDIGEKASLIWGGKLIPNTEINRINEFIESTNSRYLDDKFGSVVNISQMGEILQCCQLRSVTSFYLGAEEGLQADNSETLVFSSDVLGQGRRLAGPIGCSDKVAYVNTGNQSFFFDKFNSSIIQYSSNGLFRLSTYKMETFFKILTQQIFTYEGSNSGESYNIVMGYDPESKMVFLTVDPSVTTDQRVTIAYHMPSNRFISLYDFHPVFYGRLGRSMIMFRDDSDPFILNYEGSDQSGDRNDPLAQGTTLTSSVKVHCNESAGDVKTFDGISINSNDLWEAPDAGDIRIEPNGKYVNGMSSRLKAAKFSNQEGIYNASFLKDMLTQGSTANVADLYNGRDLRGKEITVDIKNTNFIEVVLQYVEISGSISR